MTPIRTLTRRRIGRSTLVAAIVALACLGVAQPARAQGAPAGELELLKGKAKITRQAQTVVVERAGAREPVYVGDIVHTGGDARATVRLTGTPNTIQLYAATYFTVREATPQRTGFALALGKALFNLFRGTDEQRQFDVRTPTATAGVKGTEFFVGTDGETTYLLTVSGSVGLVNNVFQQREIIAEVGQASAARPREVPTPPIRVSPADLRRVSTEDGMQAFRDLPLRSESERRQGRARQDAQDAQDTLRRLTEELREGTSSGSGGALSFDVEGL